MQVLYDHQTFTIQEYGGISRIYTELLKNENNVFQSSCSVILSNNHYLSELANIHCYSFFAKKNFPKKMQLMNFINKQRSIQQINKNMFDVFHPTYYDPYFLPYIKNKPFVVTVLDMIHEKFSATYKEFANDTLITEGKKQLLQAATKIIAISENTKEDLIELYKIDSSKIHVVYLATHLKKNVDRPLVNDKYILFVGRRERYKNFSTLLQSLPNVIRHFPEIKLVCAGGGAFSKEEIAEINSLKLQDHLLQVPFNSDEVLTNLYSHASVFIFPSLYEGFGIPILESFACECPVIASNISSLPEIGGNAALYFKPDNVNELSTKINEVLGDETLRTLLIEKGVERNRLFTWHTHTQQTFDVYKAAIKAMK